MTRPKRGDQFTHDKVIEPRWKPGRTQVWSDAPKALMTVTDVRDGFVHFTYATPSREVQRVSFEMPQAVFLDRYGDGLKPALAVVDGQDYPALMDRLNGSYRRLRAVPDPD